MSVDHGTPPSIPTDLLPYESYTEDPKWQIRFTAMWCAALGLCVVLAAPRALRLSNLKQALNPRRLLGVRVRGEYEAVPSEPEIVGREGRTEKPRREQGSVVRTIGRVLDSVRLWSLPGIPLNVGQMLIVAGYAVFALVCIILQVPLIENPNRAGFLALAQLPPVFLFASKNSPLTGLLLGPGVDYTKLNFIHRWSARFLFLGAMVHGSLWINNHVVFDLPILTQQKEASGVAALATLCLIVLTSVAPVRRWCYAAFLVLHFLLFPALFVTLCYHTIYATPWIFPPLAFYGADLLVRILRWRVVVGRVEGKEGGMSLIHIPHATAGWRAGQHVQLRALIGGRAWEAHPLSVCNAPNGEGCLRVATWPNRRWEQTPVVDARPQDVVDFAVRDEADRGRQYTEVANGRGAGTGGAAECAVMRWTVFEHLILDDQYLPPDGSPIGMLLAARACGDWSRALFDFARETVPDLDFDDLAIESANEKADLEAGDAKAAEAYNGITHEKREVATTPNAKSSEKEEDAESLGREAHLILEGPYGGPTLRASEYERVLLFAGGSGVTFTLGVLDELVGRAVRLGRQDGTVKTRRVVWCWCVRSFGAINWFAPYLLQIATLAAQPSSHIDLRIRIFVTCLCDPSAVPKIPGCTVTEARPSVGRVLERLLDDVPAPGADCCGQLDPIRGKGEDGSKTSSASASTDDVLADLEKGGVGVEEGEVEPSGSGGVAVFAAGPGSLIREAGNAVAKANLVGGKGRRAGGVAFNAEVFTI
ncbi:Iron reductase [Mycena venus]|uniref:Iron reductase n=1 Tax=Mycena venus TaxID=2733690 RepID=A0A8H7D016_9AGAR|nr:Iron reductase [Mycena venus]